MSLFIHRTIKLPPFETLMISLIKIGVFFLLLAPLVISGFVIFPSTISKGIYIRIFIELIGIAYIFLILKNRSYLPKISPLFLSVCFFIGALALSTLTSINPLRSFWGSLIRMEGLIDFLHFFFLFLVLKGVFSGEKKDWELFLKFAVLISVPMGYAGILEQLGLFSFFGESSDDRMSSVLGNPVFYGSYLTFMIFLALFLAFSQQEKREKNLFGIIAFLNAVLLLATGTRGAWIGVGTGFLLLCMVRLFLFTKGKERRLFVFAIAIFFFLFLLLLTFSHEGYVPTISIIARYDELWRELVTLQNARFSVWELGLNAWKHSPFVGYGIESFTYLYDTNVQADFLKHNFPSFDRAHNKIIDTLVASGFVGLFSYLAIFGFALLALGKYARKENNPSGAFVLISLFIAYFVQNLVAFDTPTSLLLFFFILAFIDSRFSQNNPPLIDKSASATPMNLQKISIAIGVSLFAFWTLFHANLRVLWSNMLLTKSQTILSHRQDPSKAFQLLDRSLRGPRFIRLEQAHLAARLLFSSQFWKSYETHQPEFSQEIQKIGQILESELEKKPEILAMQSYVLLAQIYRTLFIQEKDLAYLDKEEQILQKALRINPQTPKIYYLAGEMKLLQRKKEEGIALFEKAYELENNAARFYESLGNALVRIEEKAEGVKTLRKSLKIGDFYTKERFDLQSIWQLAKIYEDLNQYDQLANFFEEVISLYPGENPDPRLYGSLSLAYAKIGNVKKARETTEQMLKRYPELQSQAEKFLSTLPEE